MPTTDAAFMGEIMMAGFFNGSGVPVGYMRCDGSLLSIAQFQALYSLLGTAFGGDGRSTFALPDLRGRVAVGSGSGPGLTPRMLGQYGGMENTRLTIDNLPPHIHPVTIPAQTAPLSGSATGPITASNDAANNTGPGNKYLGQTAGGAVNEQIYVDTISVAKTMASTATVNLSSGTASVPAQNLNTGATGSDTVFNNMSPYLVMNYYICVEGIYPSRQ